MPRKARPAEPPPAYAVLTHDDLSAAFERDDFGTIARYYQQNPTPDAVATSLLVDWLRAKRRGRGRPPADDVRRDAERALIEVRTATDPRGRKEGRFRVATALGCSESKITHALTRGK